MLANYVGIAEASYFFRVKLIFPTSPLSPCVEVGSFTVISMLANQVGRAEATDNVESCNAVLEKVLDLY